MPSAEELARQERLLQGLVDRDAELGRLATERVIKKYGPTSSVDGYDFADSFAKADQASRSIDWVHQAWLRPVRFVYRHTPNSIRFLVKKVAQK